MRLRVGMVVLCVFIIGAGVMGLRRARPNTFLPFKPSLQIPYITCPVDKDGDGVTDLQDIVAGAKAEVQRQPKYHSAYYQGGYPPETEGVCTDLVWRAFREAGYDLKAMVDKDIRANPGLYPAVNGHPDPNIDFRRVSNLIVFFRRHATELTTVVKPGDAANLSSWQPGDIVTFAAPHEHIAIISNERRPDGVPYIIHNPGPTASESDQLVSWPSNITGHFRFPRF